jgi:dolichyl-diphosphooligosaccharide--protein glycosyltransferase
VAGSYDNEGVSIFALVLVFYLFLKAANTGSLLWSALCALSYFYMVSAWGGYAFITNILPIFVVFCFVMDKISTRLIVAYNVFYILGTIFALQIPFVGFGAMYSSEHLASHGVFLFINVYYFAMFIKQFVGEPGFKLL